EFPFHRLTPAFASLVSSQWMKQTAAMKSSAKSPTSCSVIIWHPVSGDWWGADAGAAGVQFRAQRGQFISVLPREAAVLHDDVRGIRDNSGVEEHDAQHGRLVAARDDERQGDVVGTVAVVVAA